MPSAVYQVSSPWTSESLVSFAAAATHEGGSGTLAADGDEKSACGTRENVTARGAAAAAARMHDRSMRVIELSATTSFCGVFSCLKE
jgi:hypothetical protein